MTQSTQEKLNKIRAQIIKLQAKADGTDNEAEQKAFAAKVRQMMEEHGISSTDLSTPVADDEDFGETFKKIDKKGHEEIWEWDETPEVVAALKKLHATVKTNRMVVITE